MSCSSVSQNLLKHMHVDPEYMKSYFCKKLPKDGVELEELIKKQALLGYCFNNMKISEEEIDRHQWVTLFKKALGVLILASILIGISVWPRKKEY